MCVCVKHMDTYEHSQPVGLSIGPSVRQRTEEVHVKKNYTHIYIYI